MSFLMTDSVALSSCSCTQDVPKIQSECVGIDFMMQTGTNSINFQDHIGLDADFSPELESIAAVEALLAEGLEHVHMLYTFRSAGRAVPMVNKCGLDIKHKFDLETFRVLTPQINKIRRLMDFQEKGITIIEHCMKSLLTKESCVRDVPDGYYDVITKVVDLLQKLDNLKDMKASLAADFSRYNRVLQAVRSQLPNGDGLAQEKHKLQLFLSNFQYPKSLIFHNLRDTLRKIPGHEVIMTDMLQQNVEFIENERYLMLDEKYRLIRSLPHLLLLIDGDTDDGVRGFNVFKDKRIRLAPLQAIFRSYPIIPECGDMSMTMLVILQRSPHWNMSMDGAWSGKTDRRTSARYSLPTHWGIMKAQHAKYLSRFSKAATELATFSFKKELSVAKYASFVSKIVVDGLSLLSSWTCAILEAYHWKLTHPASKIESHSTSPYEQAIRYNYSPRELGVLVDVVSMVKSLTALLTHAEGDLAPYLRLHIHNEMQQFAVGELLPPLHRAYKRRRAIIEPLLKLRRLVADWPEKNEPTNDYVRYSRQDGQTAPTHKARVVGPTPTQLQLLRTMVRSVYDQRNNHRSQMNLFSKRDLEREELQRMEAFYEESFCFQHLLNYTVAVMSNSDLGDLWYREFYLELSGQIQFAIELSLPWILTEHVITNQQNLMPLVENILYTMDAYNDAAHRSLYVVSQRFLYDEIEAEVNLVFDQLIFLISDHLYSYYKDVIASRQIDSTYRERLIGVQKHADLPTRRYNVPTSQRNIQLLGRIIDLNKLITQHVNGKLYKDIDYCIKKFEASDSSHIIDFQKAIFAVRNTHAALAEYLDLDPFREILTEVDEAVGPSAFAGRTMVHVLASLVNDTFPNYSYNGFTRRFTRSPAIFSPIDRSKTPKANHQHLYFGSQPMRAFDIATRLYRNFFGNAHIEAIVSTLGVNGVPLLMTYLLKNVEERVENTRPYLDAIRQGIPPCKLPKAMYGLAGCYGVFDALLKSILTYVDLKPEVFQAFKEIGNAICFIRDVSNILDGKDLRACLYSLVSTRGNSALEPPFQHQTSGIIRELLLNLGTQQMSPSKQQKSLFFGALSNLAVIFEPFGVCWSEKDQITGLEPTGSFHRVWSALSFLFGMQSSRYNENSNPSACLVQTQTDLVSDDAQFGHGFFFAGVTIMHFLGQNKLFCHHDFSKHVLRVNAFEKATVAHIEDIGLADPTLCEKASKFVHLKMKHECVYAIVMAGYAECDLKFPTFQPPNSYRVPNNNS